MSGYIALNKQFNINRLNIQFYYASQTLRGNHVVQYCIQSEGLAENRVPYGYRFLERLILNKYVLIISWKINNYYVHVCYIPLIQKFDDDQSAFLVGLMPIIMFTTIILNVIANIDNN